jgi:hypothetical protein
MQELLDSICDCFTGDIGSYLAANIELSYGDSSLLHLPMPPGSPVIDHHSFHPAERPKRRQGPLFSTIQPSIHHT